MDQGTTISLDSIKFFELSDELFCTLGTRGKIHEINHRAWKKTLGYDSDDLIGKNIGSLIQSENRREGFQNAFKLIRKNSSQQFEVRFNHKDGHKVWLSCVVKANEERTIYYLSARDITTQIESRKQLLKQNNALLSLSKDPDLFTGDIQKAYQRITRLSAETLGVSLVSIWLYNEDRTSITAANHYDSRTKEYTTGTVLTSEDYPRYFEAMEEDRIIDATDARNDSRTCEFTENYLKPLGIYAMLDAPVFLEGKSVGVICHEHTEGAREWTPDEKTFASSLADFLSISMASNNLIRVAKQLSEQNQQLEKINDELDLFVYSSSHQLRSPLASIMGLVTLIENNPSSSEMGKFIQLIKRSVSRLDETIGEINNYYKNLRTTSSYEAVDLDQMITQIWGDLMIDEKDGEIRMKKNIITKSPLKSDSHRLYVALSNLVSNAVKYRKVDQETEISINALVDSENCVITVEDNGIGIPTDSHEEVFTMFYRATTVSDGSGLGLYIVREILNKLSGKITLESVPGEFTRFTVTLPNQR